MPTTRILKLCPWCVTFSRDEGTTRPGAGDVEVQHRICEGCYDRVLRDEWPSHLAEQLGSAPRRTC